MLRDELILAFLPVVEHVARRHANAGTSVEELSPVGTVTLITASVTVAGEPVTLQADSGPTTCAAVS